MQITTIGLDIAKNVFQVHGIDGDEKVVVRKQLRRSQVLGVLQGATSLPGRHGGLRDGALLGAGADQAWLSGAADAGQGRKGLRQAQQERCRRCRGDLRGGASDDIQLAVRQIDALVGHRQSNKAR